MRTLLITSAFALALVACHHAAAAETQLMPDVGNGLWSFCEGKKAPDSAGFRDELAAFCFGFVVGVSEGLEPLMANAGRWCFAPGVTAGQKFDTVMKYLEEHPEQRNKPSVVLISAALRPIFECKKLAK